MGELIVNYKKVRNVFIATALTCSMMTVPVLAAPNASSLQEQKNAAQNGLTNCEFIADDVLKALDNIEIKPDFIVLDPPRDGIHPKALEKIIDYGVDRMVYISCKPTSLARDLVTLQERGYKVEKCCCVDMFPNTGHVETVVLLSQLK